MPDFEFKIPIGPDGSEELSFHLSAGESAFALGANGSGKSSLMHLFYRGQPDRSLRISAHRQTWFTSDSLELSPQNKRQAEQNIKNRDFNPDSRWKDDMAAARANIAIYELIDAENIRARSIAGAVDSDEIDEAKRRAKAPSSIAIINDLMRLAGLPITVAIHDNERIQAMKCDSDWYSIAELSDGERNALLIAAAVLTAAPDTLIIVDEPERHLHRAIISPLLTHLFAHRQDCAFVISTHDVHLPVDHPQSKLLLVRSCSYRDKVVKGWEIDVVQSGGSLPEELRCDILGSRRKLLFVEGTEESLDKPLYSILFPSASVVPKANCREVMQATRGMRDAHELHWAMACGLIDEDGREKEEVSALELEGIYAVRCYSVESLYYHPIMLTVVARRMSEINGSEPDQCVNDATDAALNAIQGHRDRLCSRLAARKAYEQLLSEAPSPADMEAGGILDVTVSRDDFMRAETEKFDAAMRIRDYEALLQRYPLRETPALNQVASKLGFLGRKPYEAAVLKACAEDGSAREALLGLLGAIKDAFIR